MHCVACGRRPDNPPFKTAVRAAAFEDLFSTSLPLAMSIHSVLSAFAEVLHSPEFREVARHPDRPKAFTRQRKLPLVVLVATMITGLRMRIQTELDHFFAFLLGQAAPVGHVSEQAFAKARQNLDAAALPWLNRKLIDLAESHGMVPRWRGLRLVAADGSIFHPTPTKNL